MTTRSQPVPFPVWNQDHAAKLDQPNLLLYRSNLLGSDLRITNYGGGNTSAKIAHLNLLPQGQPERSKRVLAMMKQMEAEGFGNCTNQYECEAACPKGFSVDNIARLNRDFIVANTKEGLAY